MLNNGNRCYDYSGDNMPYVIILVSCVLDHLLTARNLAQGGGEANPVMAVVMAQPFWASFLIKNGWTVLLLLFMYHLAKRKPLVTGWALRGIAVVYLGVIIYHIWGVTTLALIVSPRLL